MNVPAKLIEASLPSDDGGNPLWAKEADGSYTIPVYLGPVRTSKRVSIHPGKDGIHADVQFEWKGSWRSLWVDGSAVATAIPIQDGWQDALLNSLRQMYQYGQDDERDWYVRNNKPIPTSKPKVKRYPIKGKRVPDVDVPSSSIPVEAVNLDTGATIQAAIDLGVVGLEFEPSSFQLAIWNFIKAHKANVVVEALAGSGKTTTIVEALKIVPRWLDVAFVAFNRRIANTLKEKKKQGKLPQHVHVSTMHSLGLSNLTKAYGIKRLDSYINEYKVLDIIKGIVKGIQETGDEDTADNVHRLRFTVRDLVSLIKATLSEPTAENVLYLSDRYGVELNGDFDLLMRIVIQTFHRSVELIPEVIDYDDMIYGCAIGLVACRKFDVLFVDECQDLNAAQIELAKKSGARIVCVGDRFQSIYGFRGADVRAMQRLIDELAAETMPLSITYRMPTSHVEYVKAKLPHIPLQAAPNAVEGVIADKTVDMLMAEANPGDLVMCRCNAPLVGPAFALIRKGIKAVILGRDIGKGLAAFMDKIADKHGVSTLSDVLKAMREHVSNETAKLTDAGKTNLAQLLRDKFETIVALSDGCDTVADVKAKIKQVFSDKEEGVVFSSVHKAKGTEAKNVWILEPQLMPHPNASQEWELEQEWNIWYVAHSRSLYALYFVRLS